MGNMLNKGRTSKQGVQVKKPLTMVPTLFKIPRVPRRILMKPPVDTATNKATTQLNATCGGVTLPTYLTSGRQISPGVPNVAQKEEENTTARNSGSYVWARMVPCTPQTSSKRAKDGGQEDLMDEHLPKLGPPPSDKAMEQIRKWWEEYKEKNKDETTGRIVIPMAEKQMTKNGEYTQQTPTGQNLWTPHQSSLKLTPRMMRERNIPYKIRTDGQTKEEAEKWGRAVRDKWMEEAAARKLTLRDRAGKMSHCMSQGISTSTEGYQNRQDRCGDGQKKLQHAGDASTTPDTQTRSTAGGATSRKKQSGTPILGITKPQKTSPHSSTASHAMDQQTQHTENALYAEAPYRMETSTRSSPTSLTPFPRERQSAHTQSTPSGSQALLQGQETQRSVSHSHTARLLKLKSRWMTRESCESECREPVTLQGEERAWQEVEDRPMQLEKAPPEDQGRVGGGERREHAQLQEDEGGERIQRQETVGTTGLIEVKLLLKIDQYRDLLALIDKARSEGSQLRIGPG